MILWRTIGASHKNGCGPPMLIIGGILLLAIVIIFREEIKFVIGFLLLSLIGMWIWHSVQGLPWGAIIHTGFWGVVGIGLLSSVVRFVVNHTDRSALRRNH